MKNHPITTHPYHLVNYSPWPLTSSIGTFCAAMGLIQLFYQHKLIIFSIGNIIILMTMYQWWRDISRESTFQGLHTINVTSGMQWGMILFIISEIFFFISFFWTFFYLSLTPVIALGETWPPLNIKPFNPFQIPLLNTTILLTSGITLTWAHNSLLKNSFSQTTQGLLWTVLLGIYFTILQGYEYMEASFTMSDSSFGSTFFLATGFHGIHVIIGTIFLTICLIRHMNQHFSKTHHFGFEAASWYWHFVDVIWLFLYIFMYWWNN